MSGGCFLAYRDFFDPSSRWHPSTTGEPACRGFAWLDLVSMARHEPSDGLERGDLYVSVRTLAVRWNWGRTKTAEFLDAIVDAGAARRRTQSGRKVSVLSICDYDVYRVGAKNKRTQGGRKADASREVKEQYVHEFEVLWRAWKGKVNNPRKPALTGYIRLRDSGVSADTLRSAVTGYYRYCKNGGSLGTDRMMMAQTFFGPNERWKNFVDYHKPRSDDTLPLLNQRDPE